VLTRGSGDPLAETGDRAADDQHTQVTDG
jgi:hypothetical protein